MSTSSHGKCQVIPATTTIVETKTIASLKIPTGHTCHVEGLVTGRTAAGASFSAHVAATVKDVATVLSLVAVTSISLPVPDAALVGALAAISVDAANNLVILTVTGLAVTTIIWGGGCLEFWGSTV